MVRFKVGRTLRWPATYRDGANDLVDLSGYAITSHVRRLDSGALVAMATVTISDQGSAPGDFEVVVDASSTATWPVGVELAMDIRIVQPDDDVDITETITILPVRTETRS